MPGFTPENPSCRNQAGNGLPESAGGSRLSQRIGHAGVAFTMKQYVQTDLEADRQVADTFAELIIGGSLASFEMTKTA